MEYYPDSIRIALIKSSWHRNIVDEAANSFVETIHTLRDDVRVEIFRVPGAFEIPLLAKRLARSQNFDVIVACGFIVDGGIYRHDFVADTVVNSLMNIQLDLDIPLLSGVLIPHQFEEQTDVEFFEEHMRLKGAELAHSAIKLLHSDSNQAELNVF